MGLTFPPTYYYNKSCDYESTLYSENGFRIIFITFTVCYIKTEIHVMRYQILSCTSHRKIILRQLEFIHFIYSG